MLDTDEAWSGSIFTVNIIILINYSYVYRPIHHGSHTIGDELVSCGLNPQKIGLLFFYGFDRS